MSGHPPGRRVATAAKCLMVVGLAGVWHVPFAQVGVWNEGRVVPLVYHGRPLPKVIEDIQPYTRRRIVIDAAAAEFQYSGIVKQEDVDAWIRDLPAIYPVTVIDCQTAKDRADISACTEPTLIVIRSRLDLYQNSLRSALTSPSVVRCSLSPSPCAR